jgi:hypothetical protein
MDTVLRLSGTTSMARRSTRRIVWFRTLAVAEVAAVAAAAVAVAAVAAAVAAVSDGDSHHAVAMLFVQAGATVRNGLRVA